MAKRHWLGKAAALDPHRDIAFPVPLHKELRPLHFCRTICFKPLASWFSQLLRFLKTLHRSLFRKIQAMTIHIHREPAPPVLICRYLHTRFINCHVNLSLQMSKTKATNFLRLIAFGLIIWLFFLPFFEPIIYILSFFFISPYNQVFFSINSILFDTCQWMELRLWSDLYLIQGRYIVIMGTPNKTSSLFVLNGLDVYPSLYGSSPLMSNRIILLTAGPHFLRSACP